MSRYTYRRRASRPVRVGGITIGGTAPIRVQSMNDTDTNDITASVAQAERIIKAGGELIRLTTQGVREAEAIGKVRQGIRSLGYDTPIVADVHFNRNAAFMAARNCDKVRINPGNFADAARTFKQLTYTDDEYARELERIQEILLPFLDVCRENGTAIRLGINHGSLSDRIMSRYGDSPSGMTESAMEYLRICREADFNDVVISMKSSNPVVMVEAVRTLVEAMDAEGMNYPLHLGVTEAGDGQEARIKSAVGIGTLLAEGLGDTIRVSLSEAPENEIPVAKALVDYVSQRADADIPDPEHPCESPARKYAVPCFDGVVAINGQDITLQEDWHRANTEEAPALFGDNKPVVLTSGSLNIPGAMQSWIDRFIALGGKNPIILEVSYDDDNMADVQLKAAADLGPILMNGYGAGIHIVSPHDMADTELIILQATRLRFSRTEFIACPGCGRTMFDLHGTLAKVKAATAHLPGLRIGVMGCIVNGPGEMADADYGYVGAAAGKISLYKGKVCVEKNIPQDEAIDHLIALLKAEGVWHD
ncbi:MAG: (E)-4-hydroxy-3-methylbut-2-enyl-diphosphate synthase [Muribaculaceae bacterium]|nr:(E)-4-hydroxy-3-methylbut-2-enyl-diphosphate synthase [Muribaculaceae bacterium]